jgi:hypothetical protein
MEEGMKTESVGTIVLLVVIVVVVALLSHDDCGRQRIVRCLGGGVLEGPGTYSTTWRILEPDTRGGYGTTTFFTDEAYAQHACKEGKY